MQPDKQLWAKWFLRGQSQGAGMSGFIDLAITYHDGNEEFLGFETLTINPRFSDPQEAVYNRAELSAKAKGMRLECLTPLAPPRLECIHCGSGFRHKLNCQLAPHNQQGENHANKH